MAVPSVIERAYCSRESPGHHGGFAIMRLRFLGLFVAATFALSAEHSARAETRPAETCSRAMFRVVVDVGHTEKAFGATSARGLTEFSFNLNLAKRIEQDLLAAGFRRSVLLISEGRSCPQCQVGASTRLSRWRYR